MKSSNKNIKICIVSSSGGHLFKIMQLKSWWKKYNRFWVVKNDFFTKNILNKEKKYYGFFPENRNIINFFKNLFLAYKILYQEKPNILFSMGAGIAPPFFLIAKIFGIKTIFIETFILIPKPTLSGKIIYRIAAHFLVQNKQLLSTYPHANYLGKCL